MPFSIVMIYYNGIIKNILVGILFGASLDTLILCFVVVSASNNEHKLKPSFFSQKKVMDCLVALLRPPCAIWRQKTSAP